MRLALFVCVTAVLWACTPAPSVLPMEGTAARGQKLVVLSPVVMDAPAGAVSTLSGALSGAILTYVGKGAVSAGIVRESLAADFPEFEERLFDAARKAFEAGRRDLEDQDISRHDTTLFRQLSAAGDRISMAFKMQHLDVPAPSHLLATGIRLREADVFSSRRVQVWAFVIDRERRRLAYGFRMEFSAADNLYRLAEGVLRAGHEIAVRLAPWFPVLPPARVVRVTETTRDDSAAANPQDPKHLTSGDNLEE